MAKKPASKTIEPVASQTPPIEIDIASIVVPKDRLWETRPESVDLLADAILENGYIAPIAVCAANASGKYSLIDGAHRLEAAKQLGREVIPATVFSGGKLQQRMLEIDSNLIRRNMTQLEEAVYLAERKRIYEQLYPVDKRGGDRKSDQFPKFGNWSERFAKVAARQANRSESAVQLALWRFSKIAQDVRTRISGTWLEDKGTELDAIAKLEPDEQRAAVDLVLSGEDSAPKTIGAASKIVRGVREEASNDDRDADFLTFTRKWSKNIYSARTKRNIIAWLEDKGHLAGSEDDEAEAA